MSKIIHCERYEKNHNRPKNQVWEAYNQGMRWTAEIILDVLSSGMNADEHQLSEVYSALRWSLTSKSFIF